MWGYAKGGMSGITQALRRSAEFFGVEIRTNREVHEILVKDGRAVGVKLALGEIIESRAVLWNADPKRTFL